MQDITTLQAELEAIEARKADLEFSLKEAKVQRRETLAAEVRAFIADNGFEVADILPLLQPQPNAKRSAIAGMKRYALKSNPGLVYGRGRLPDWLQDAMRQVGMDPASPDHRKSFRDQYMVMVEG